MLASLRKGAQSGPVKILLILLALTFAAWGVGDMFRGRVDNSVATVGDESIPYELYSQILRQEVNRFQQQLGTTLTPEQITSLNLKNRILGQLINGRLLSQRAEDLNLYVDDEVVRNELFSNPVFQNASGEFDKDAFFSVLRAYGLTEKNYLKQIQNDIAVEFLAGAFSDVQIALRMVAETLFKVRNEERLADIITVPSNYIKRIDDPSETDLVQFYQEHNEEFAVPELRKASYVIIQPDSVAKEITISDDELQVAYEERIDSYRVPEQRQVQQYLLDDKEAADAAYAKLSTGEKDGAKPIDLGLVAKDGLPVEVSDVVFGLEKSRHSKPVESPLGWHIFEVSKIVPAKTKSFKSVKKELRALLLEEQSGNVFYETLSAIEDDLAGGISIEKLAKNYQLTLQKTVSFDSKGNTSSGKAATEIPDPETFVPLIFQADMAIESSVQLLSDQERYVVFRVDAVEPRRIRALDEVKGKAIELWKAEQLLEQTRKIAQELAQQVASGAAMQDIVRGKNLSLKLGQRIKRQDMSHGKLNGSVPAALTKQLFRLNGKEATSAYRTEDGAFVVARLVGIEKDKPTNDKEINGIVNELKGQFVTEVMEQYNLYLKQLYPVSINYEAVNASY